MEELGTAKLESDWKLEQEFNCQFLLLSRMCLAKCQILSPKKYPLAQDGGKQNNSQDLGGMIEQKKNGTHVFVGQNSRFVNAELEEG